MAICPHVADSERVWSLSAAIDSAKSRNRIGVAMYKKMAAVSILTI